MQQPHVVVVGIGPTGLAESVLETVLEADVVIGSPRQLDLLPPTSTARRLKWGSPLRASILPLLEEVADGEQVVALASGDPLVHGVATTLIDVLGAAAVSVRPAVSSVADARAHLLWPAETTTVIRDHREVPRYLVPGARILVLSNDGTVPVAVAAQLRELGFGDSTLTVLSDLGGPFESIRTGSATTWSGAGSALHILAIAVAGQGRVLGLAPGLPDDAFDHDGQLTKRDVRAAALARLAPLPGEHLWDVGAGAGSVGIEWARTHPHCSVSAVEQDPERAARIRSNALRLGAPRVEVTEGAAPEVLADLPDPDAVFVGGGATRAGLLEACWDALDVGGRLVVHGVTLETEAELVRRHGQWGGELTRLSVEHVDTIGSFRGWAPARTVVQWSVVKGENA